MKSVKNRRRTTKLTKLHLLKSQEHIIPNINNNIIELQQLEIYIKKSLKIIYKYHCNNKKIIFVGVPVYIQKKFKTILAKTKHIFIMKNIWVDGMLTNKYNLKRRLKTSLGNTKKIKMQMNKVLTLKQRPHLVVLLQEDTTNINIIREAYKLKIPIIQINSNFFKNQIISYKVPYEFDFNKRSFNNLYFLMIISIFKKFLK